jgi:two-component system LytT family sensor kinase
VLILGYTLINSVNQQYWNSLVYGVQAAGNPSRYYLANVLYALWFTLISSMLFYTQQWIEQKNQVKNIQISQLQHELRYLRAQINPHFLFNGLNTIYGYIDMKNEEARNILLQFSDLLRYHLYEADVDFIALEKEEEYLRNYVILQKARSNDNIRILLNTHIENKHVKIAPLIFIPFVENAFKHCLRDGTSSITITLEQHRDRILFTSTNSFVNQERSSAGIGIINVTRRLDLLYPGKFSLNTTTDNNVYSIHLTLTL